jgi:RsiW-degrading membrane proteinase PrsW (M82 family)
MGRAYERFLELPPIVALVSMWLVGGVLLGLCTMALYSFARVLLT